MVRCKFICLSKREFRQHGIDDLLYDYEFSAVTTQNSKTTDENKSFWKFTPFGQLKVATVTNDQFEVDKEYYLDLTATE